MWNCVLQPLHLYQVMGNSASSPVAKSDLATSNDTPVLLVGSNSVLHETSIYPSHSESGCSRTAATGSRVASTLAVTGSDGEYSNSTQPMQWMDDFDLDLRTTGNELGTHSHRPAVNSQSSFTSVENFQCPMCEHTCNTLLKLQEHVTSHFSSDGSLLADMKYMLTSTNPLLVSVTLPEIEAMLQFMYASTSSERIMDIESNSDQQVLLSPALPLGITTASSTLASYGGAKVSKSPMATSLGTKPTGCTLVIALCSVCDAPVAFEAKNFKEHVTQQHVVDIHQCSVCYTSFMSKNELVNHQSVEGQCRASGVRDASRQQGQG